MNDQSNTPRPFPRNVLRPRRPIHRARIAKLLREELVKGRAVGLVPVALALGDRGVVAILVDLDPHRDDRWFDLGDQVGEAGRRLRRLRRVRV